ncbi:PREDICTED: transmembrane protein PVRIG isoform X1 [Hipposideros armiger]|uniref:Transmembrane protein PVRIG isoform X1 n=1 Tax=Hipposideros armiger TaxID=186990 RepID=A0A8B7QAF2_HIPAR|nr:PREDICTED: transmembrane protein PVRIG isoform X1 [Hipposideros armiger]
MDRPRALVLLLALLTLCITAGTPEVWVQIQMESTKSPFFTVRCGFLGSSTISLVTVSCGGPDGARGTKLAVLHPELGIQQWPPASQAHWETRTSISLTMEGSEGKSSSPNTTFCCKFTSFPEGSQEACSNHLLDSDQGLPAPTPASILRADLAGILGVSGVLLFGCIYLLHLLHRQRHWSVMKLQSSLSSPQAQTRTRVKTGIVLEQGTEWVGSGGREVEPHLGFFPHHPCRQPAKPPWPLSTSPMPPLPPTTAQQLWTRSSHPSHCLSGCRSPPTQHTTLPPGHLCQPLLEAVSSLSKMDSMLGQERGLPTRALNLSLSLTLWGPEL